MIPLVIQFPNIKPELFEFSLFGLGPFGIRWYALAYIAGFVLGWLYLRVLVAKPELWEAGGTKPIATKTQADDFLVWAILGVLIGGRLGHVLFYGLWLSNGYYLQNPLHILYVWEGGMSFHGGLIGVIVAILWFCRRQKLDIIRMGDAIACVTPFGLFFGRVANFINAEIWGKVTDPPLPWSVVFCNDIIRERSGGLCPAGELPRHPAQLYEAILEGIVLFAILYVATRIFKGLRRPGLAIGIFLIVYALFRIFVEVLFRDSNNKIGTSGWTIGIVLSIPMVFAGLLFVWHAFQDKVGTMPLSRPLARLSTHERAPRK